MTSVAVTRKMTCLDKITRLLLGSTRIDLSAGIDSSICKFEMCIIRNPQGIET